VFFPFPARLLLVAANNISSCLILGHFDSLVGCSMSSRFPIAPLLVGHFVTSVTMSPCNLSEAAYPIRRLHLGSASFFLCLKSLDSTYSVMSLVLVSSQCICHFPWSWSCWCVILAVGPSWDFQLLWARYVWHWSQVRLCLSVRSSSFILIILLKSHCLLVPNCSFSSSFVVSIVVC